jgi:hypothetical protein
MSIRKHVSLVILVLGIALLCGQAFAAEFTADLLITQPNDSITIKLFVRDHLYRVEKLDGDDQFLAIENRSTNLTTAMNPEEKTYRELEGPAGAFANPVKGWEYMTTDTEEKLVGTETVNGFECDHYTYSYPGQAEPMLEAWKSKQLEHFIKYLVHYGGASGDGSMEILNVVEGPLNDALFKVPGDYTRQKTEDEIEMERPAITSQASAEAPVGRRIAPGGELSVKMNPEMTFRVELKNLIRDSSSCQIQIYKNGQKVDFGNISPPKQENFSLSYKGERRESMYGRQYQADEVRIKLEKGRMMVTVYSEYSSFDEVRRYEYYVTPPGRGIAAIEGRPFHLKLIGDSPTAEFSRVRIHVYGQDFVDGVEQKRTIDQLEFDLKNNEVRTFEYPVEKKADYISIEIDEGGGLKLFTEQP